MQFALLIFESQEAFAARNADENDPYLGAWRAYYKALLDANIYVGGDPLQSPGDRDHGATQGWKAAGPGWSLRGYQGAIGGIRNPGAALAGRGARMGGAMPGRLNRCGGGTAGFFWIQVSSHRMSGSGHEVTHRTIERVARESYGRLVAYLCSHTRDVGSAEDALSHALVKLQWKPGHETACHTIQRRGC